MELLNRLLMLGVTVAGIGQILSSENELKAFNDALDNLDSIREIEEKTNAARRLNENYFEYKGYTFLVN